MAHVEICVKTRNEVPGKLIQSLAVRFWNLLLRKSRQIKRTFQNDSVITITISLTLFVSVVSRIDAVRTCLPQLFNL